MNSFRIGEMFNSMLFTETGLELLRFRKQDVIFEVDMNMQIFLKFLQHVEQ